MTERKGRGAVDAAPLQEPWDTTGVQAVYREPETVPPVLSDGTVTGVEGAPEDDGFVVCGIDGCAFAVERGEGRTMALHQSEDHDRADTPALDAPVASADEAWLGPEYAAALAEHLGMEAPPAIRTDTPALDAERQPLAEAVINALDAYGTMGNGEGWTLDHDVIGTLWLALTPGEKSRTGYDVEQMDARHGGIQAVREGHKE